jgi:hypothetical protein
MQSAKGLFGDEGLPKGVGDAQKHRVSAVDHGLELDPACNGGLGEPLEQGRVGEETQRFHSTSPS